MDIYGNNLVNTVETKPLCISLLNLADMFTIVRGWPLLILEVKVTMDIPYTGKISPPFYFRPFRPLT